MAKIKIFTDLISGTNMKIERQKNVTYTEERITQNAMYGRSFLTMTQTVNGATQTYTATSTSNASIEFNVTATQTSTYENIMFGLVGTEYSLETKYAYIAGGNAGIIEFDLPDVSVTQTVTITETVTQPAVTITETVTQTVTETVTQPAVTITETVTDYETITETVTTTITETVTETVTQPPVTVTQTVTVTDYETITETVTVTETDYETVTVTETHATAWETVTDYETVTVTTYITETFTQTVTAHETSYQTVTEYETAYPTPTQTYASSSDVHSDPIEQKLNLGMFTTYALGDGQLDQFGSWLWSSDLATILKRWFQSPMDAILGLTFYNGIQVNETPGVYIKLGTQTSTVTAGVVTNRFAEWSGWLVGSDIVGINPFGGPTALLYSPYSKYTLTIPYVGEVDIPGEYLYTETGRGKRLWGRIVCDVLTGAVLVEVYSTDKLDLPSNKIPLNMQYIGTYNGNCSSPMPISGASFQSNVQGGLAIAGGIGGLALAGATIASGGATLPLLAAAGGSIGGIASGMLQQSAGGQAQRSGQYSSSYGMMGAQRFILTCDFTEAMISSKNIKGYIDNKYAYVEDFEGYLEIYEADTSSWINDYWVQHTDGLRPNEDDIREIVSTLKEGVWL